MSGDEPLYDAESYAAATAPAVTRSVVIAAANAKSTTVENDERRDELFTDLIDLVIRTTDAAVKTLEQVGNSTLFSSILSFCSTL